PETNRSARMRGRVTARVSLGAQVTIHRQMAISPVLLTGLLSLFVVAAPAAERPWASQTLHDQCLMSAADPKNPWALAHGITALGPNYVAADGRKASDVMVHDFLLRNVLPDGGPGAGARFGFLKYAADGTPIEPHTNLITKTLL